jgi:hypothetical protein
VAVDGAHIYWTVPNANTIGRANLDGSGVNQNFITGGSGPNGVAVDATHVYWTNIGSQFNPNTIGRADLSGGNVNQSFIPNLGGGAPEGVAVDSAHVYWTDVLGDRIARANLDGTGVEDDFIGQARNPTGIAVDAGQLYWSNFVGQTIGRANVDGSNVNQSFISGAFGPEGVAVDALTTAPPPPPTIADLVAEVTGAGLPHGIERSLLAKLEGAQRKFDAGHLEGACGSLGAYHEQQVRVGDQVERGVGAVDRRQDREREVELAGLDPAAQDLVARGIVERDLDVGPGGREPRHEVGNHASSHALEDPHPQRAPPAVPQCIEIGPCRVHPLADGVGVAQEYRSRFGQRDFASAPWPDDDTLIHLPLERGDLL